VVPLWFKVATNWETPEFSKVSNLVPALTDTVIEATLDYLDYSEATLIPFFN